MAESPDTKKAHAHRKDVAKVPEEGFDNHQLSLFQRFLANAGDKRSALSNAVDLWDRIPRYAVSRMKMNGMRTAEGFLPVLETGFNYRSRQFDRHDLSSRG